VSGLFDLLLEAFRPTPKGGPVVHSADELEAAILAATAEEFGEEALVDDDVGGTVAADALTEEADSTRSRPYFLLGLVLGSVVAALVSNVELRPATLGAHFDQRFGSDPVVGAVALFVAGWMIGLGTRLAGGCTSGHGITGVACFQSGSLLSTATFWTTGAAVSWAFFALVSQ
jgi:hypothetical protein